MTDLERVTNVAIFILSNIGSISSNCRDINCENNHAIAFATRLQVLKYLIFSIQILNAYRLGIV